MKKQAAFPRTGFWPSQQGGDIDSIRERQSAATEPQDGMTLRDYFAAKAMQGLFGSPHAKNASILLGDDPDNVRDVFVRRAYDIADAMLKAREQ